MQKLKRSKSMNFRVTQKEYEMIRRRMEQTGMKTVRAYLLKMAIDGRVIHVELDNVKECSRLLGNIANNINQIAKQANGQRYIYGADIDKIFAQQDEIWVAQGEILQKLCKIIECL